MIYVIQCWTNEQYRGSGFNQTYQNETDITNLDEAIRQAQKIVDSIGYACAEVIEFDTDKVVYGYDGINFWYGA